MNTYHTTFFPNSDPDNIQRETLIAENIQQIEAMYQTTDCTLIRFEVKAAQPENLGTNFTISGGEVMELDAHLEAQYESLTEEDMPF
jgi:hypothetical protein